MVTAFALAENSFDGSIRTLARPDCAICGAPGVPLYENLTDRFFDAPGRWNFARCTRTECAMLWINPAPIEDDLWKAYRNYFTHDDPATTNFPNSGGVTHGARQAIKRAYIAAWLRHGAGEVKLRERALGVLAYLDPTRRADTDFPLKFLPSSQSRGRLLDLGCGSGALLLKMRSLGWETEGVDIDPLAVKVARCQGLCVRLGSLHAQNFADASFDAVVMSHVIEHVHEPLELLKEVRRILKRGRRLVIATPNATSLAHRMLGSRWPLLDPPRHLQVFTTRALHALVRAAGFDDIRVCTEVRTAAAMFPRIDISRIVGRLFVYGESLMLNIDGDAGEEIALCAAP